MSISSRGNWDKVRTALKGKDKFEVSPENSSEKSFSTHVSSKSRARRSRARSRYNPKTRHLLSGPDSIIAERYNIRPNFTPLPLFRRGVRIVLILIKAGGCFRSKPKMTGTVNHITVNDDEDQRFYNNDDIKVRADAPIFNPYLYKADRSLKLSRQVVKLLRLHPSERTAAQIGMIVRGLQVVLGTFSDYPLDTQTALAKFSYLEIIEPGRLVMKKGDRPLRFHIIIVGRALVTEVTTLPTGKENIQMRGVLSRGETFGDEHACFLHAGGDIHSGANFMPRKHTIISQKEMHTLTLDAEDYLAIFHPDPEFYFSSVMVSSCIKMLARNEFLRYWPLEEIRNAHSRDFRLQYFRKGTIITSGADEIRKLIFIKNGSCQVLRRVVKRQAFCANPNITQSKNLLTERYRSVSSANSFFRTKPQVVFVHEKRLDVGDMFGIECHFDVGHKGLYFRSYDDVDHNVNLVSNGAEVIIFSAAFYRKHLNEQCNAVLTLKLETTPSRDHAAAIQVQEQWQNYKSSLRRRPQRRN